MKKTTYWILGLISISSAFASEPVRWQLEPDNALPAFEQGKQLLGQAEDKSSMVQLLLQRDFVISAQKVVQRVKDIRYYPTFVDTDEYGSKSVYFDKNSQNVRVLYAATMAPSGAIQHFSPQKTRLLDTNTADTFTDQQELIIPFQGLEEGSLSVIEYEIETDRNENISNWSVELYTQRSYPITTYSASFHWDEDDDIHWRHSSDQVQCTKEASSLECKGNNIPSYIGDKNTYWQDIIGRIEVSELNHWDQVIRRASNAMSQATSQTQGLSQVVKNILTDSPTTDDKIKRILEFVARDIRYVSMSEADHAIVPHSLAETISNRYGDCKDKSVLLKAMLEQIGIPSTLVLVDTDRYDANKLLQPSMNHFNHVVVCFEHEKQSVCLDPTDTQTNWKYTPRWVQGKASLALKMGAKPEPLRHNLYRWQYEQDSAITFHQDGSQTEEQNRNYKGEYAAYYRGRLQGMNDDETQTFLKKEYADIVSSMNIPQFLPPNADGMDENLIFTSVTTFDPILETNENAYYVENDAWIYFELDSMQLSNEHYDEWFSGLNVTSSYTFDLSDSPWRLTLYPPILNYQHDFGSLVRTVKALNNKSVRVETQLTIPAQKIAVDDIPYFNQFLDKLKSETDIGFTGKLH